MQEVYGVKTGIDSGPALGMGGGIGHTGDACGVIVGGAIAIGELVKERVPDHVEAKNTAVELAGQYYDAFKDKFGVVECINLIQMPIRTKEETEAYKASGKRQTHCEKYLEFAVDYLSGLRDFRPKSM